MSTTTEYPKRKLKATDAPPCNGNPPAGMRDPIVRRTPVNRATWLRAIRGRLPHFHWAVANALASYGNKDGSNCHPGIVRLTQDLMYDDDTGRTVVRELGWLETHGFIALTRRGSRKLGEANVFCLTLPATVAVDEGEWDGSAELWIERPKSMDRSGFVRDTGVTKKPAGRVSDTLFLGDTSAFLGDTDGVLGDTGDPPPDLESPELVDHHADAHASGASTGCADREPRTSELDEAWTRYLCDGDAYDGVFDDAAERVHVVLGLDGAEYSTAVAMAEADQHPRAIMAKVLKDRRRSALAAFPKSSARSGAQPDPDPWATSTGSAMDPWSDPEPASSMATDALSSHGESELEIVDAELVEDDPTESVKVNGLEEIFSGDVGRNQATFEVEQRLATVTVVDAVPPPGAAVEGIDSAQETADAPAPVAAAVAALPFARKAREGTRQAARSAGPCAAGCTGGFVLVGNTFRYCLNCRPGAVVPMVVAA